VGAGGEWEGVSAGRGAGRENAEELERTGRGGRGVYGREGWLMT